MLFSWPKSSPTEQCIIYCDNCNAGCRVEQILQSNVQQRPTVYCFFSDAKYTIPWHSCFLYLYFEGCVQIHLWFTKILKNQMIGKNVCNCLYLFWSREAKYYFFALHVIGFFFFNWGFSLRENAAILLEKTRYGKCSEGNLHIFRGLSRGRGVLGGWWVGWGWVMGGWGVGREEVT